jgi:hypothetical protein
MIVTAQQMFDAYIRELDKIVHGTVKNPEQAIIMAEVLMVKVKQLFQGAGYHEEDALLFIQHALQELEENKPTIH